MEELEIKKLPIDVRDVYQLLISECRYGYTRNNHLMPDAAYDKCKRILPEFYKVDPAYAIHTAQQLAEECISDELVIHFYDGIDDEHGNRRSSINFIEWLFSFIAREDPNWKPYNNAQYVENLQHDDDKVYMISDVTDNVERAITTSPVSIKDYMAVIYSYVDGDEHNSLYYTKERTPKGIIYHIQSPVHKDISVYRVQKED